MAPPLSYGTVSTKAGQLYYEQEGNHSGPTILFIHGLGGTVNLYQPLMVSLCDFNIVRFDWAGHGRSAVPKSTSIDSYVDDVLAIITHLSLKHVTVVAHSLGGLVAMNLAAKHPEHVDSLVLFGPLRPPPEFGRQGAAARADAVRRYGMTEVVDTVLGNSFPPGFLTSKPEVAALGRELLCRQPPEGYALACLALSNSVEPQWDAIRAPTTIVSGDLDRVSRPEICSSIKQALEPSCAVSFISWDGVGHWYPLERPTGCAEIIRSAVHS